MPRMTGNRETRFGQYPAFRPEPDPEAIREAVAVLSQAQRPIIVAGGGVTASGAGPEVLQLAELLSIPVATALNAKETIPDDHPLNVGIPGTYSRWCANRALSEANLVFFIGSHTGSQVTTNWQVPRPGVPTIQLDISPEELGRPYPNRVSLHGDAKATLQKLIAAAQPLSGRQGWLDLVQGLVREYWAESEPLRSLDAVPIRPERICKEISDWLPEGGIVVSDTGHSGLWMGQMIRLTKAGQRYLRNNFALNQEKHLFDSAYGGQQRGRAYEMWTFDKGANLAKVAEGMRCVGIRVERPADIRPALDQALAAGRPAVVEVLSDIEAMAKRAWVPSSTARGH